ncbi:hypothetical protein NSE01_23990 [Novosphingobium sediminis]|uniref:Novel STAND NTPase 3 domain-containing protein n=1 Tax=Novosphingobium sediminis TaxID=707214 RepID=A0A512ALR3_9SPHN|nr:hypothetical protein NSE01_23990 [Novosphingobium sediminis]
MPDKKTSLTGAAAAQAGYDYQVDVSILAALRLLLITKAASRLILEPANEEDLEADLAPNVPGRVEPSAVVAGGYKLVIQVKRRSGEPWSIEDFRALLQHGKARRPALHHLDDPETRYLLVTSADAKGVARDLLVNDFEEPSDKSAFPSTLKSTLKSRPEGRVAIWGSLTEKQLAADLRDLMSDLLHVPKARQNDLLLDLRGEAKRRIRASTPGIWTRQDLLGTVRKHGGFLASSASLELFVPPSNFDQMIKLLEQRSAIVIRGPSGTGKTQAALKLCELARDRDGTLEIVTVGPDDNPASTRKLVDTGPTLYYIEDPWGQYSLRGGSEAWTTQLPRLLEKARPDHLYVITSRDDMMRTADVGAGLDHWSIELDGDQYSDGPLIAIHDNRMDQLPAHLQAKAFAFRTDALQAFETPLEIDLYFKELQKGPAEGEADHAFFRRLREAAHREAVQNEVGKYLSKIDSAGLSAIVWALLAARSQFDRAHLTALQRTLRRIAPALGDELNKVVDRLVATRHLRQPARTVAFAHPSVKEGFEAFLQATWPRSEAALEVLIAALTKLGGSYSEWGLETAARAFQVTRAFSKQIEGLDPPFYIDPDAQAAIDAWLDDGLIDEKSDFSPLLELSIDVGSSRSVPSEVARWLLLGVQRGASVFLKNWKPPTYSDAWYDRIAADPLAAQVAARFVRDALPWEQGCFGRGFPQKLDRIAPGLAHAYCEAAQKMVGSGFESNADTVAVGAVRDLAAFAPIVEAALDDLTSIRRYFVQEGAEEWRAIQDGERDHAVEEGHQSNHEGDGYTSGVFVDAYIAQLRREGLWRNIAAHCRVDELLHAWARDIATSTERAEILELRELMRLSQGKLSEHQTWWAARENWYPELAADLRARLMADTAESQLRSELVRTAVLCAPDMLIEAINALSQMPAAQLRLVVDVWEARGGLGAKGRSAKLKQISDRISPGLGEIADALGFRKRPAKGVGGTALAHILSTVGSLSAPALKSLVPVIVASGGDAAEAVTRWLIVADDNDDARAAAEAAVVIGNEHLMDLALHHERADARRVALIALAKEHATPLPDALLRLANDPGSRVRRALVAILKTRPHPDHLVALRSLIHDTWSDNDAYHHEPESHPIAREAIEALANYDDLPVDLGRELLDVADRSPDRLVSQDALIVAAHAFGSDIRAKIWEMVLMPVSRWIRLDALDALVDAEFVEPEIVAQVTAPLLLKLPAVLAVPAAVLLCNHAAPGQAVSVFERVASSNNRRALLLVGAATLAPNHPLEADQILDLLEPGHPARGLLSAPAPLPTSVLDDLGKIRLRRAVRERLGDRLIDPPLPETGSS